MDNYRPKKSKDFSFCQGRFGTERERGIRKPSRVKRRDAFTEGPENRGLIPRKSALHGRHIERDAADRIEADRQEGELEESVRSALVRHIKRRCHFEPIRARDAAAAQAIPTVRAARRYTKVLSRI
ncbi:hypothetical protein QQF64_029287 [Cirrhinus molitorella]|uniref:Uncharacterized protein n=1 Tax=Cirrhinus molitorella TaxID=172907 RepID=A0ABR3N912_9TELE